MTSRSLAPVAVSITMLVLAAAPARSETTTAPAPYRIEDGRVIITGWDDAPFTTHVELLRLLPESFSTSSLYRRRLILKKGRMESAAFEMPRDATRMRFAASGDPVENEFPRIRLSLVPADDTSTLSETVVFDGFVASLLLQNHHVPVPPIWRGRTCRVALEMTNPSDQFDSRILRLAYIAFEREDIQPRRDRAPFSGKTGGARNRE